MAEHVCWKAAMQPQIVALVIEGRGREAELRARTADASPCRTDIGFEAPTGTLKTSSSLPRFT